MSSKKWRRVDRAEMAKLQAPGVSPGNQR
jgi:hypothetical protein